MIPKVWDLSNATITQNGRLYTISPLNPSEFSDSYYYLLTTNNLGVSGIDNVLIAVVDTSYSDPNSVRFIANSNTLSASNIRYLFRLEDTILKQNNISNNIFTGYLQSFNGHDINNLATVIPSYNGYSLYALNQTWTVLQAGFAIRPSPNFQIGIWHHLAEFLIFDILTYSWTNNIVSLIDTSTNTTLLNILLFPNISKYLVPVGWFKRNMIRPITGEPSFLLTFRNIDIDFISYTLYGGKATGGFEI